MSEPYDPDNLLDGISTAATLDVHYTQEKQREQEILTGRLGLRSGDVLSVGCGWDPGRHLFPKPEFRITGVELDSEVVRTLVETGEIDEGIAARAGSLPFEPGSFDVVLYRLVLHHVVYQGPLAPVFTEAARLLRPGGALVALEPGSWHPVGFGLGVANRLGLGTVVHGTPDDVPLSPRRLVDEARAAGLEPELHSVTYGWRRLPPRVQRALHRLDRHGSRPRAALLGHTLLLIARKP